MNKKQQNQVFQDLEKAFEKNCNEYNRKNPVMISFSNVQNCIEIESIPHGNLSSNDFEIILGTIKPFCAVMFYVTKTLNGDPLVRII